MEAGQLGAGLDRGAAVLEGQARRWRDSKATLGEAPGGIGRVSALPLGSFCGCRGGICQAGPQVVRLVL